MSFFHSAYSMFLEILCHQLEAEGSSSGRYHYGPSSSFLLFPAKHVLLKTGYIFLKQNFLGKINWNIQNCPLILVVMRFQDDL